MIDIGGRGEGEIQEKARREKRGEKRKKRTCSEMKHLKYRNGDLRQVNL